MKLRKRSRNNNEPSLKLVIVDKSKSLSSGLQLTPLGCLIEHTILGLKSDDNNGLIQINTLVSRVRHEERSQTGRGIITAIFDLINYGVLLQIGVTSEATLKQNRYSYIHFSRNFMEQRIKVDFKRRWLMHKELVRIYKIGDFDLSSRKILTVDVFKPYVWLGNAYLNTMPTTIHQQIQEVSIQSKKSVTIAVDENDFLLQERTLKMRKIKTNGYLVDSSLVESLENAAADKAVNESGSTSLTP